MFVGMSLALGSWWGLFVFLLIMPALIWRIFDEENLLAKNLPGYSEYREKVKCRLIPFIWYLVAPSQGRVPGCPVQASLGRVFARSTLMVSEYNSLREAHSLHQRLESRIRAEIIDP